MAATSRKLLHVAIALASLALAGAGGTARPLKAATARPLNSKAPISYDASTVSVDYRTQHAVLQGNVVISQDDLRVTADRAEATGLNFQNSRWTFTGDVHISSELRGKLQSDEAVVEFRDNRMQTATATGHPAQFEQTTSNTGILARGHADTIEYAVAAGTIRLITDAWVKYGDNDEIRAPELLYNIKEQRLEGVRSARPGQRVHLTIVPKKTAPPRRPAKSAAESTSRSAPGSAP
jgi:lipopolysaccharide transport protein LptA